MSWGRAKLFIFPFRNCRYILWSKSQELFWSIPMQGWVCMAPSWESQVSEACADNAFCTVPSLMRLLNIHQCIMIFGWHLTPRLIHWAVGLQFLVQGDVRGSAGKEDTYTAHGGGWLDHLRWLFDYSIISVIFWGLLGSLPEDINVVKVKLLGDFHHDLKASCELEPRSLTMNGFETLVHSAIYD